MINLSFDELRLIAQLRSVSEYENKSKEDLIKALTESKLETPKPEISKLETPKSEISKPKPTPKLKTKTPKTLELEPKIRVKTDNRK